MDIGPFKDWITTLAALLAFLLSLYTLLTKPAKESSDRLKEFEEDADDKIAELAKSDASHALRIQKLENEMQHMPDKDMVHRMELTMKDMQVQMATMASETQATGRSTRRVEEWLLTKGAERHG